MWWTSARATLLAVSLALSASGCADGQITVQAPGEPAAKQAAGRKCPPARLEVVDLTHSLHAAMAHAVGGVAFEATVLLEPGAGARRQRLALDADAGTHVDAPAHLFAQRDGAAKIAVRDLVAPLAVLDVRAKAAANPDYVIGTGDLMDWEDAHGEVAPGSVLVANTGWHARFRDPDRFLNRDAAAMMHFPSFGPDAAKWLLEREVVGIGIDTASVDPAPSPDLPVHRLVLGAGRFLVEGLANLDDLPPSGATVVIGVLPVVDGTQAPARVLALVPEPEPKPEP